MCMSHVTFGSQCRFECFKNSCTLATIVQIILLSESLLHGMEEIQKEAAGGCGVVGSEPEGEGKAECEGSASVVDRGALWLCASTKTLQNCLFECINRALQFKDAITRFSKNDMELDGWIDGKDDEETLDV